MWLKVTTSRHFKCLIVSISRRIRMIQQCRNKSTARYSVADTENSLIALFPKGPQKSWLCRHRIAPSSTSRSNDAITYRNNYLKFWWALNATATLETDSNDCFTNPAKERLLPFLQLRLRILRRRLTIPFLGVAFLLPMELKKKLHFRIRSGKN